jgi:electron transfer flavoprotein alpha subunit
MTQVLVVAEHDNKTVKKATLNAIAARAEDRAVDIDVLVAGHQAARRRSRPRSRRA